MVEFTVYQMFLGGLPLPTPERVAQHCQTAASCRRAFLQGLGLSLRVSWRVSGSACQRHRPMVTRGIWPVSDSSPADQEFKKYICIKT